MNGSYQVGDLVLGEWRLSKLLGQGSYGKVFEGEREDFGVVYRAAIKIITIPQSQSEIQSARAEGLDDASVTAYFRSMVEEMVQEFGIMSRLKGNSNIVSYEDHRVIPHTDEIGWDIIIRMECLRPMLDFMGNRVLEPGEVAKVGVDMCKALELCALHNIIHRDIKPENMFVNDLGDFKLGDFGIARTIERGGSSMSKKGTYTYMAPEIYKEEPYDASVDIYSLGIVLYRLLNNNRAPFLPLSGPMTHSQREQALLRRMSGAPLPPPCGASAALAQIVLKACAYKPKDRWQSPGEMRRELEKYLLSGDAPVQEDEDEEERTVFAPPPYRPLSVQQQAEPEEEEGTVSIFASQPPSVQRSAEAEDEEEGTVSVFAGPPSSALQSMRASEKEGTVRPSAMARPAAVPVSVAKPPAVKNEPSISQPEPCAAKPEPSAVTPEPLASAISIKEDAPSAAIPTAPPHETERGQQKKELEKPAPVQEKKKPAKGLLAAVIGVAALAAILAVLYFVSVFGPKTSESEPTPTPIATQSVGEAQPTSDPGGAYIDDNWDDSPIYNEG